MQIVARKLLLALTLAPAFAVITTTGCAHLPENALGVPVVEQATDYSCGPATLLAVLRYWGKKVACEQDLYAPLHTTPKDGTEPDKLAEVARQHGLRADYRVGASVGDLRAALASGTTVILDLQAWRDKPIAWRDDWDDGHYIVLVAIEGDRLYAMDPSADDGFSWLRLGEFEERWHDFELHDGQRRNLQHMAVFIAGDAHVSARGGRPEKLR